MKVSSGIHSILTYKTNRKDGSRMKYKDLKNRQSVEVNSFPMAFAFNEQQFTEGLQKLGVDPCSYRENIVDIGGGGFIRKTDEPEFSAMFLRHKQEMQEAMLDDGFMLDAFAYELSNHEYCITGDPTDTLVALNVHMPIGDSRTLGIFAKAKEQYLESVEGW